MEETIKLIIADLFNVDVSNIKNDSGIIKGDIPNWDSLGHLQLILKIEEVVGVKFTMQEIQNMHNYEEIISVINMKV